MLGLVNYLAFWLSAYLPKTGPLIRFGIPCSFSIKLLERSNEDEVVCGRIDYTDAVSVPSNRSEGGLIMHRRRHFVTKIISLEKLIRPDGGGKGVSMADSGERKCPTLIDRENKGRF